MSIAEIVLKKRIIYVSNGLTTTFSVFKFKIKKRAPEEALLNLLHLAVNIVS